MQSACRATQVKLWVAIASVIIGLAGTCVAFAMQTHSTDAVQNVRIQAVETRMENIDNGVQEILTTLRRQQWATQPKP